MARRARVVSVGRNAAWIAFDDEHRLRPASLRKHTERLSLVTGDLVLARDLDGERAVVDSREPRSFALTRTTAGGRTKTMAANIDAVAIVAAFDRPPLHLAMVDELLAFAEIHGLRAFLLLTKPDLVAGDERERVTGLYRGLGYAAFELNPKSGGGVAEVEQLLAGHQTLLIGQSGVGKSSLFAALGGGGGTIGAVSKTGRGRQTTTSARLQRLGEGFLIDSPGVGEFELQDVPWRDVVHGFTEFRELAPTCRFRDCTHRSEPGCSVRTAVNDGVIARGRYASYLSIVARAQM
ncbi:MAG TPA: ribosome small subunit-dependent GTPase A [Candidatus Acidoferrales bacterium]|nr:ribosome small subunit-dependent GTPase A [Candidatus Acidoferrales bacterium]